MDGQVPEQHADKYPHILLVVFVVIAALAAIISIAAYSLHVPRGQDVDLITGFDQKSRLMPASQYDLAIVLATNYHEFRNNSSRWSFAYFGCLFLSAVLSAFAAFILKLECFPNQPALKKDVAALCSTVAAVLITLSTVGNFQQKWQANRLAATAMQNLVYEAWQDGSTQDKATIYTKIEEINLLRNQEIVGGDVTSKSKGKEATQEKPPAKDQPNEPGKGK
jgi:hypothetical protein